MKTNRQRQESYRARQKQLGRYPRQLFLTDEEFKSVKLYLKGMRLTAGEKRIDIPPLTLAEIEEGIQDAVWSRLRLFPRIEAHGLDVWRARRERRVRRLVARDKRFLALRVPWGPTARPDWELLALAALEAAGHPCTRAELYQAPHPE